MNIVVSYMSVLHEILTSKIGINAILYNTPQNRENTLPSSVADF